MGYSFIDNAKLNDAQREAVMATEGGVLVLAGAGSGKTRVLTHRVVHLIKDLSVKPWNVLAITFTNKAAGEMKERINDMCGYEGEGAWVSTFHSMCVKILKMDIQHLGYDKNFSIYDEDDSTKVISEILKEKHIEDIKPKAFKGAISSAKNKMVPYEALLERKDKGYGEVYDLLPAIYLEYENRLKKNNALDFDDLLLRTIQLFKECPAVLEKYQKRFKYIMVDEYQDTNYAQYILVRMLGKYYGNVCVVGDDDQSIYGWRGADISNIRNFEKDYKNARVIKLEQNYRSTNNILKAANAVIGNNTDRKIKTLWSEKDEGEKITVNRVNDDRAEAGFVASAIAEGVKNGGKYSDFAILYRLNSASRNFEEAMVSRGIPYRVYGGQRFYDRKEIKDALAYMRLVLNPNDEVALKRIVNVPKRGIGSVTIDEIERIARDNGDSMFGVILDGEHYGLEGKLQKKFTQFVTIMQELIIQSELLPLAEYIDYMFTLTGLIAQYEHDKSDEAAVRIDNLREMISAARQFSSQNPDSTLEDYMEHVSLVTELEGEQEQGGSGAVNMMTLHSAKGLEFDTVFLVAMEDGVFPLSRAIYEADELEEERRLCYVGITRAMRKLYITSAETRFNFREQAGTVPSRFIKEIPEELLMRQTKSLAKGVGFGRTVEQREPMRFNMGAIGFEIGQGANARGSQGRSTQGNRPQGQGMRTNRTIGANTQMGFGVQAKKELPVYKSGMKVVHKTFGQGTIIDVRANGNDQVIKIAFPEKGIKEFSAKFAPLTIVN